jgi:hypothetical protein
VLEILVDFIALIAGKSQSSDSSEERLSVEEAFH